MSKTKDLGKAVILALGLTGLGASVSSCLPLVAAGAGAYAGTKMAQPGDSKERVTIIKEHSGKICYDENGKSVCVCGSKVFKDETNRFIKLAGPGYKEYVCNSSHGSYDPTCTECLAGWEERIYPFEIMPTLKIRSHGDVKDPSSPYYNPELAQRNSH